MTQRTEADYLRMLRQERRRDRRRGVTYAHLTAEQATELARVMGPGLIARGGE